MDRGPYLNLATPNSIVIKWRTTTNCDSKVFYGPMPSSLNNVVHDPLQVKDHEVLITGLQPYTKYYYAIASNNQTLTVPSFSMYFFTMPPYGSNGNYKFWVVGDAGTGSVNQTRVKNGFLKHTNHQHIDGWIWLGDNAYDGGFDSEYQSNVFQHHLYGDVMRRIVVWPAPGNHDYNHNLPFSPSPAYFNIFTLPSLGQAGGHPSGTEAYYSFNYGNIHFISLDSYDQGRGPNDPMAQWLQTDLANNTLPWVIAYWHHPPYTKGSHNSDNSNFLDGELVDMRQNILPILENHGVDLVLCGHSHCYERSKLIDSHYGYSNSLQPSMIKDNTGGNYPLNCPYQKHTIPNKAHKGTVYAVVGCSGKLSGTSSGWPHPVMHYASNTIFGSMLLEINHNRLDAKFIDSTGAIIDRFTIVKNAGGKKTYSICPGQSLTLTPSWKESVNWFPIGVHQSSLVVSPPLPTIYYAHDNLGCIKDTFVVNFLPPSQCTTTALQNPEIKGRYLVYPSPVSQNKFFVEYINEFEILNLELTNVLGQTVPVAFRKEEENIISVEFNNLSEGIYNLRLKFSDQKESVTKIIINH
ncbi:MAG: metallophosphoesterase [Bacteroidia bacterium]|nr:metallophosphoesterase [Bacteroidia bacterium]